MFFLENLLKKNKSIARTMTFFTKAFKQYLTLVNNSYGSQTSDWCHHEKESEVTAAELTLMNVAFPYIAFAEK